jgi:hypothetical protein
MYLGEIYFSLLMISGPPELFFEYIFLQVTLGGKKVE